MKKLLSVLLALLISTAAFHALGEGVIVNRVSDPDAVCEFAEGAELLEIYFPKISGVDAAYVRYGEYSMLIDCAGCGNPSRGIAPQWPNFLALLKDLGVTEVTYAVSTHPDGDHIGGFNHVLKEIACGEFILGFPEDFDGGDPVRFQVYDDLHAMGIPFRQVHSGDTLEFGGVSVTVYQRTDDALIRVNNQSLTLLFQLGERRIYFAADIMGLTQRLFYNDRDSLDLHADILKYPHHGYEPMYEGFLKLVQPKLCVITGGQGEAVDGTKQLRERKIKYVFAEKGTVHLATDGHVWLVERSR